LVSSNACRWSTKGVHYSGSFLNKTLVISI
jgi:hypothetical protein